jgi:hypothetical protein
MQVLNQVLPVVVVLAAVILVMVVAMEGLVAGFRVILVVALIKLALVVRAVILVMAVMVVVITVVLLRVVMVLAAVAAEVDQLRVVAAGRVAPRAFLAKAQTAKAALLQAIATLLTALQVVVDAVIHTPQALFVLFGLVILVYSHQHQLVHHK